MQKVRRKRGRKHAFDFLGDSEAKRSEIRLHDVRGCATVELVHNGRYETQKSKQEWSIIGESSEKRYTLSIPGVFESLKTPRTILEARKDSVCIDGKNMIGLTWRILVTVSMPSAPSLYVPQSSARFII